jgi:hypothetical protein
MVSPLEPSSDQSSTSEKVSSPSVDPLDRTPGINLTNCYVSVDLNRFDKRSERPTLVLRLVPCAKPSTIPWRQLRPLGRYVLIHGLSSYLLPTKGRSLERDHGWRRHWWSTGYQRWHVRGLQASLHGWIHSLPHWGCLLALYGHLNAKPNDDVTADVRGDEAKIDANGVIWWRKPLGSRLQ